MIYRSPKRGETGAGHVRPVTTQIGEARDDRERGHDRRAARATTCEGGSERTWLEPMPSVKTFTVPAKVVAYLRSGVKSELAAQLAMLAIELEGRDVDEKKYNVALARFDAARALFDAIGPVDRDAPQDLEFDLTTSGDLVLKVLTAQHRREVQRLEDAFADGITLSVRDVPALETARDELRRRLGVRPKRQASSFLMGGFRWRRQRGPHG